LKIAYFDCFSGISGDMCLGALVDAGVSLKTLEEELLKIPFGGYRLTSKKVKRSHIAACKVDVILYPIRPKQNTDKDEKLSLWKDVAKTIHASSLSEVIKKQGLNIFKRIFKAEAKVHGKSINTVHLHELGATDCIVDIFGALIGLDMLGIEKVYASPINLGKGFVKTEHGMLPVPAPATAEILTNTLVYSRSELFELTTPTGAAIIKELSAGFGDIPVMEIEKTGIGAGGRDFKDRPNILRLFIGDTRDMDIDFFDRHSPRFGKGRVGGFSDETITVIETNIDDMNPQLYEYVMERLFKAGALDVFLTQIIMKKGRPGVKLTVLCNEQKRVPLSDIILKETTTIGLRFHRAERKVLQREIKEIDTEFGKVRVKVAKSGTDIIKTTPEYDDCKRIAKKLKIPLIEVMRKIRCNR
jgi:pyridinium-3,5-bisthiocarboxylic acid mononucleotide nickel chelatase